MFGPAAFFHFGVNRASDDVARRKFHALGVVLFHEALTKLVAQYTALAANRFRDEKPLHTGRPNHPGGMELNEFHIHQFGPSFIGERHAVAAVLPGIGSDRPRFSDAAGSDHDGLGFENDEAAIFAPVAESSCDATAVREQTRDGALHVNVKAQLHAAILQRSNHFQAGAVADVAETLVRVAAESALQNRALIGAVEESAPLFEFADTIGSFLRMKLRHAPIIQKFSAAHGVAEMRLPAVVGVHIAHGCGDAAFGHDGVRFSEQRLANNADARAFRERFDGGAQSGATGANNQYVVFVGLVAGCHRILRSWMAPLATRRT